jgi:hypothetical protein
MAKKLKDTMIYNFKKFNESVTKNELMLFLNDFGFFITMNLAKSIDEANPKYKNEMTETMFVLRKPIINGLNYSQILNDTKLLSDPKFLSGLLSQIRNLLLYLEPRIDKYIEGKFKNIWLDKITDFKVRYKKIVS